MCSDSSWDDVELGQRDGGFRFGCLPVLDMVGIVGWSLICSGGVTCGEDSCDLFGWGLIDGLLVGGGLLLWLLGGGVDCMFPGHMTVG